MDEEDDVDHQEDSDEHGDDDGRYLPPEDLREPAFLARGQQALALVAVLAAVQLTHTI